MPDDGANPSSKTQARYPHLHLASRSPRRQSLLREHGFRFDARHPGLDDAELAPGPVPPTQWVAALAYLKAMAGLLNLAAPPEPGTVILGADTACVKEGKLIGTPTSADEAREMLRGFRDGSHEVVTGVALIDPATGRRDIFADAARVEVGPVTDGQIEDYLATGEWQGKAGGYNLSERIAAGWPIRYQGDPSTVMGLPMQALQRHLDRWSATPAGPGPRPPRAAAGDGTDSAQPSGRGPLTRHAQHGAMT